MYALLFFVLILLFGLFSIYKAWKSENWSDAEEIWGTFGWFFTIIGGVITIFMVVRLIYNQTTYERELANYNSLKSQLIDIRSDKTRDIERVALSKEIIDYNLYLANEKYDNDNQWDWWVPDTIANLKPLK